MYNTVNGVEQDVFEEEVYPNCTVIVYRNVVTGETRTCWVDNTKNGGYYETYNHGESD